MALSPEDKIDLQAMLQPMVLDAVTQITTGVTLGIERYLRSQMVEMQADLGGALDKLEALDREVGAVKTLSTQIRREQMKDVRRGEADHERGVSAITEIAALKYQVTKLTERLDSIEKAGQT